MQLREFFDHRFQNCVVIGVAFLASSHIYSADLKKPELVLQPVSQIEKRYPGARIEMTAENFSKIPRDAVFLGETPRGEAIFETSSVSARAQISIPFNAWQDTLVARRRVLPGETLSLDAFSKQEVDVSRGQAHELRGLMLSADFDVSKYEARQTLLEGQYVLASAIQRAPDARRGDIVKLRIVSGTLLLNTLATVQEPGNYGKNVRVMTTKTKRELVGKLMQDGSIEVLL